MVQKLGVSPVYWLHSLEISSGCIAGAATPRRLAPGWHQPRGSTICSLPTPYGRINGRYFTRYLLSEQFAAFNLPSIRRLLANSALLLASEHSYMLALTG